jgi:hypothetical protein
MVEIFLSPREFAGCKACAQVVESSWESFGQNVHESSRNLFFVMRSALIRSYAWKSTAHLTQKFSTGLRAATFSTNPQTSSQQQGSKLLFLRCISCNDCCGCEKDRFATPATAFPDIRSRGYFHSVPRPGGLYTLPKNEYSTLAVQMHGRNHVRNRNRTRGKPINGIQRNQVGAA